MPHLYWSGSRIDFLMASWKTAAASLNEGPDSNRNLTPREAIHEQSFDTSFEKTQRTIYAAVIVLGFNSGSSGGSDQ